MVGFLQKHSIWKVSSEKIIIAIFIAFLITVIITKYYSG